MIQSLRTEFLQVYRHLLRAASYLPDPAARTYLHSYVRRRFRAAKSNDETQQRDLALDKRNLLKAQQNARNIWRAANGDPSRLSRVLFLTYGRSGKRRRVLVDDLLRRQESTLPMDHTALQRLIEEKKHARGVTKGTSEKEVAEESARSTNPRSLPRNLPHPTSKLGVFIDSQISKHPRFSPRSTLRVRRPTLPKTGARCKPLALRRQRNIVRKWWAETLDRLLPPVTMDEWERLRDLATGKLPVEKSFARRSRPLENIRITEDEALLKFLTAPARLTGMKGELVIDTEKGLLAIQEKDEPVIRTQSARSMRRLYHSIWALTPTMEFDQDIKKWKVKWGGEKPPFRRKVLPKLSKEHLELFEVFRPHVSSSEQKVKA